MKKLIALLLISLPGYLFAQKNKSADAAQMEAMMKNIQKQMDSMMKDPRLKGVKPPQTAGGGNTKGPNIKNVPAKDSIRIRNIPRANFTLPELTNYINDLRSQLSRKLPADAVRSANEIARKLNNDPAKLDAASLHAWQKGATEEALLLSVDAASKSGGDGLLLTNTGAILDMSGLPEKAIPILRTIVRYNPDNAIAHNNLGQAYTQLGLHDSAMYYLGRCINLSPKHPEANNTAGHIELKRGNKAKAKNYFENSISGSFSLSANKGLRTADPKAKIRKLVKPKVKIPEYFNQWKYKLLPQCHNVKESKQLEEMHREYRQFYSRLHVQYEKQRIAVEKQWQAEAMQRMQKRQQAALKGEANLVKPFQGLAAAMESELTIEFSEAVMELEKFNTDNRKQYRDLEAEYNREYEKYTKANQETCESMNDFNNKFLDRFAQLNEEWQHRNLKLYHDYIDEFIYWGYLSSSDDLEFSLKLYTWADRYMQLLGRLSVTKTIAACREDERQDLDKPIPEELKQYDCPLELEIPFVVGALSADCEKFSFSVGEGVVFRYEKNFTGQRQSTMSLGIGAGIYLLKVPGAPAGIQASANMSVFLSFDNMGHLMDGGVQNGAKASAGIEFEAGERIKIKKEMKKEVGFGWRFGINSGVSFDDEPLKKLLN
jgi:tetratricopeptide (TPR) repeat protein